MKNWREKDETFVASGLQRFLQIADFTQETAMCSKLLHAAICAIGLAALLGNPTTVSACGLRFRHGANRPIYYTYPENSPVGYSFNSQPAAVEREPTIAKVEGSKSGAAPAALSTTQTSRFSATVSVPPTEPRVLPLSAMGSDSFPSPIPVAR
jgi:hypothetical protein